MPNYNDEDEKYDAGGDSFGAIFSDLLTGAAGAAAGVAAAFCGCICSKERMMLAASRSLPLWEPEEPEAKEEEDYEAAW